MKLSHLIGMAIAAVLVVLVAAIAIGALSWLAVIIWTAVLSV